MRRLGILLLLLVLAGCTVPEVVSPVAIQLEIIEEDQGWVKVRVTGIGSTGYQIRWGDVTGAYGVTDVVPWEEFYVHFYQAVEGEIVGSQVPTTYHVAVVDDQGIPVASQSVYIDTVVCHLELVSLNDREVTVEYWGRFGIEYSISWGDRYADHVMVSTQSGGGTATHNYAAPGTYSVGMEEIWAPSQIFFTIEVK